MRIHTDNNGVYVNAISMDGQSRNVAGHQYTITAGAKTTELMFQLGGVAGVGVNGITSEALLAILIHRTTYLNQAFPCPENFRALYALEEALAFLEVRTARRVARGVEGKNVK